MILSSLLTLSSPLVSFLKNSKIAPVPAAALANCCFSAYFEGDEAKDTSPPVTVELGPADCDSFCFYLWWMKIVDTTYRCVATLDDREEFIKLNLLTAVFVDHGNNLGHLLSVFYQT